MLYFMLGILTGIALDLIIEGILILISFKKKRKTCNNSFDHILEILNSDVKWVKY